MLEENTEKQEMSKPPRGAFSRHWWIFLLVIIVVGAGIYAYFPKGENKRLPVAKPGTSPLLRAVPVVAVPAKEGEMKIYLNGLGSVTPLNTVTVKSRVDGQLMEVLFKEGQVVTSGQLLARIDPRPFEVQLTQAEGQLARDQALLKNAILDLQRYRDLWQQDSIPKQQLDTQEALVRQYEGNLKVDQGQIDNARLQLIYCRITSPIGGRVGLRLVDPGNIIHAADPNGLVVITQLQPISVIFSLPEDNIPQVLRKLKSGANPPVEAYDRAQSQKLAAGTLQTVDNQIDTTTGTVRLKALFENKEGQLFPNQFVNARLLIDVKKDILIIPAAAIQQGPKGPYVFCVKPDRTVTICPIVIGEIQGGEASLKTGLSAGTQVVVDGAERLREGARVELRGPNNNGRRKSE